MVMNCISQANSIRPSKMRRFVISRWFMSTVAVTVVIGLASMIRDHVHSASIRERLTGTWTIPVTLSDGSVEHWIEEFRPDGTLRHYPPDKPPRLTGPRISEWKWHISGSDLVIVYEAHFASDASLKLWIKRFGQLVRDRVTSNDYELYSDRLQSTGTTATRSD